MKFKNLLMVAVLVILGLSARASDKSIFYVEIRCLKGIEIKSNAGVYSGLNFRTDHTTVGTPLSLTKQREDGEFKIFQQTFKPKNENPRAIIITPCNQTDQVFLISLPHKLQPMDWTNWQRPNYVETNAASNFRFNYIPPDRSTNISPNSFEFRYKIE